MLDSVNDVVATIMRPAPGALLFAGAVSGDAQWVQVLAVIAGLATAGTVHGVKATARPVINATTGGVGGPVVSVVEDGASIGLIVAAIFAPLLVLVFLAAAGYGAWRLLRRLRRGDTAVDAH